MIVDFGSALRKDKSHEFAGTPDYMAPEIITCGKEGYDSRVDLFSLGIVYYELWANDLFYDLLEEFPKSYLIKTIGNFQQDEIEAKIFEEISSEVPDIKERFSFRDLRFICGEYVEGRFTEYQQYRDFYLEDLKGEELCLFDCLYILHGLLQVIEIF